MDAKSSGEVVRGKRLTKARGQRGESDGAEESEHRQAVYTGNMPHGAGPEPWECWRMRELHANARADYAKKWASESLA